MKRRGDRGTTFIELMMAIAVIGTMLIGFLSVMWSSSSLSAAAREASVASIQLQLAVENTFSSTFDSFVAGFPAPPGVLSAVPARLRNEQITITAIDPPWPLPPPSVAEAVTYRVDITYTDAKGRTTRDFLMTRRTR